MWRALSEAGNRPPGLTSAKCAIISNIVRSAANLVYIDLFMKSGATTIFGGLAVALAIGCVFAWSDWSELTQASETKPRPVASKDEPKSVLPAGQFFGQAAVGYQAAQQCPEIVAKLFCYCGCDLSDEHTSLLDCFTSTHGADCPICTDEAVIALQMKKQGKLF